MMMQLALAILTLFTAIAHCAQPERLVNLQSMPKDCYLTSVTREKLLKCARDIKLVDACFHCKSFSEVAAKIERSPYFIRKAQLLAVAYRHGKYVSGLLFKRSENKYLLSFVGAQWEAKEDANACANIVSNAQGSQGIFSFVMNIYALPEVSDADRKRAQDKTSYGADYDIGTHTGFYLAGRDGLETIAQAIQNDATPGLPIRVLINGHSMGGALAFQAAYFLKKVVPDRLGLSPDQVQVNIAAFAAAGYFHDSHFKKACDVIGQHNALVFRRPGDYAVDLSSRFDFYNPACVVQLDYHRDGAEHNLLSYEAAISSWNDPGIKRFNTLVEKAQGRRARGYPKWKPHLQQAKLRLKYPSESDSDSY